MLVATILIPTMFNGMLSTRNVYPQSKVTYPPVPKLKNLHLVYDTTKRLMK
jgi:hypothetical protein